MPTAPVDDFQGADKLPVVKFPEVGAKVVGQIMSARQVQDRDIDGEKLYWDDNKTEPRMVWVMELDTTETGEADSAVFVKGNLYTQLRAALKEAAIPTVGALVQIVHSSVGEPKKKGFNPPKLFTVKAKAGPPIVDRSDPFADTTPANAPDTDDF